MQGPANTSSKGTTVSKWLYLSKPHLLGISTTSTSYSCCEDYTSLQVQIGLSHLVVRAELIQEALGSHKWYGLI